MVEDDATAAAPPSASKSLRVPKDTDTAEQKRAARRTRAEATSDQRDATQQHLDAQQTRLQAYADSLTTSLEKHPTGENAARITRQLEDVQRQIGRASRPRMVRLPDETPPTTTES